MGFKFRTEAPGLDNRLDLALELSSGTRLVIEMKYCRNEGEPTPKELNQALAAEVTSSVPLEAVYEFLAPLAKKRMSPAAIARVMAASPERKPSPEARNRLLGEAALQTLPEAVTTPELAKAAKALLSPEQIEAALESASKGTDPPDEEIDRLLTQAAQEALDAIVQKKYHKILDSHTEKGIDLGLAVYGYGQRLKAAFAPEDPKSESEDKAEAKTRADVKPKAGVKPRAGAKPKAGLKPKVEAEAKPGLKPRAGAEAKPKPKAGVKRRPAD